VGTLGSGLRQAWLVANSSQTATAASKASISKLVGPRRLGGDRTMLFTENAAKA
jgi:hypothetical protein